MPCSPAYARLGRVGSGLLPRLLQVNEAVGSPCHTRLFQACTFCPSATLLPGPEKGITARHLHPDRRLLEPRQPCHTQHCKLGNNHEHCRSKNHYDDHLMCCGRNGDCLASSNAVSTSIEFSRTSRPDHMAPTHQHCRTHCELDPLNNRKDFIDRRWPQFSVVCCTPDSSWVCGEL